MYYQHVYQAEHCDFLASCERITRFIPSAQRSWTGRIPAHAQRQENAGPLCFRFPDTNVHVHLFSTCKIQVSWTDQEKEQYYEKLKNLLIPMEGYSEITLKPIYAAPRIFPETKIFEVAWCPQKSIFTREDMNSAHATFEEPDPWKNNIWRNLRRLEKGFYAEELEEDW